MPGDYLIFDIFCPGLEYEYDTRRLHLQKNQYNFAELDG